MLFAFAYYENDKHVKEMNDTQQQHDLPRHGGN
jgi:hypothetical protein